MSLRPLAAVVSFFAFITIVPVIHAASDGRTTWQPVTGIPAPNAGREQTDGLLFDVDKDGLLDMVVGERTQTPSVVWYKRTANNWTKRTIFNAQIDISAGGTAYDIDNDGDLDYFNADDNAGNQIYWFENPYPNYNNQWSQHIIRNTGQGLFHDMIFADFDGDGRNEFATWNQEENRLLYAEIPTNPASIWTFTPIFTWTTTPDFEGLAVADIDLDGKVDIIGGGRWFKHQSGATFQANVIDPTMQGTRAQAAQIIPGGRPEVVFGNGDNDGPLAWYQWQNNTWQRHQLLQLIKHGHTLQVIDIDKDGHLDIFAAEMGSIQGFVNPNPQTYFFYGNSQGDFEQRTLNVTQDNHESKIGDLDGDGDNDFFAKPYQYQAPGINVYLNQSGGSTPTPTPTTGGGGGLGNWQTHVIGTRSHTWRTLFVGAADLNGDNRKDIIAGADWYRNPGTVGGNWTRNLVGGNANNFATTHDFDNDGDQDILSTTGTYQGANFVWAQNNGSGTFTIRNNISPGTGDFLQGVLVNRFNSGNSPQVALSWHGNNPNVQILTVPGTPATTTWPIANINNGSQFEDLSAGDIDRDGDQDLLTGSRWLRNNGGTWSTHTLYNAGTTEHPDRNNLADINRDGRLDAIVGYEAISVAGKLAWYEQGTNATGLWTERIIADNVIGPMSMDTADLDNDGDIDVIVGEHNLTNGSNPKLYVFENRNNGNQWIRYQAGAGYEHHDGTQLVDLDNDGDLDIISIGWGHGNVLAYENKNTGGSGPTSTPTPTSTNPTPTTPGGLSCPQLTVVGCHPTFANTAQIRFDTNTSPISLYQIREFDTNNAVTNNYDFNPTTQNNILNVGTITAASMQANPLNSPGQRPPAMYCTQVPLPACDGGPTPTTAPRNFFARLAAWFTNQLDVNQDGIHNVIDWLTQFSLPTVPTNTPTPPSQPTATPTPPAQPTATPTNGPTPRPGNELILYDRVTQFIESDSGFHEIKDNGVNVPGLPTNWLSPVDYFNGQWYMRYQIVQHPSNTPGRFQTCIWQMPGYTPEICPSTRPFGGVGSTITYNQAPANWALITGPTYPDFTNPRNFKIRVVLRGEDRCNVTQYDVAGSCWNQWPLFQQMRFRLTIVMVSAGSTFSGWQNYP